MYHIVIELQRTIEKSLGIGIAQKACTALFPLSFLRGIDIPKIKRKWCKEETSRA